MGKKTDIFELYEKRINDILERPHKPEHENYAAISEVEREIYTNLIQGELDIRSKRTNLTEGKYIIAVNIDIPASNDCYIREITDIDQDIKQDYMDKSKFAVRIDLKENFAGKVYFLSKEEKSKIFSNGGWDNFHNIFGVIPLITFSRPGINKNMNKGIMWISSYYGGLAGSGELLLIMKKNNRWYKTNNCWVCKVS